MHFQVVGTGHPRAGRLERTTIKIVYMITLHLNNFGFHCCSTRKCVWRVGRRDVVLLSVRRRSSGQQQYLTKLIIPSWEQSCRGGWTGREGWCHRDVSPAKVLWQWHSPSRPTHARGGVKIVSRSYLNNLGSGRPRCDGSGGGGRRRNPSARRPGEIKTIKRHKRGRWHWHGLVQFDYNIPSELRSRQVGGGVEGLTKVVKLLFTCMNRVSFNLLL